MMRIFSTYSRSFLGVLVLIAALALLAQPISAVPPDPVSLTNVSHSYLYGEWMRFRVAIPLEVDADEAVLHLQIGDAVAKSITVPIENRVATWERDLQQAPIRPFITVSYWWTVQGDTPAQSDTLTFRHDDNRFTWQQLESNNVTVYWLKGNEETMRNAVKIAWDARAAMEYALDATLDEAVDIYIYPSAPDLQNALNLGTQKWIGGLAYPELGVIAVAIPQSDEMLTDMRRSIPHEMMHKALYDVMGEAGYAYLPEWLSEGLSASMEQSPNVSYALALETAVQNHALIPMDTLCQHFPENHADLLLSYAQSQSFVRFLQRNYGWDGIRALIAAYVDGFGYDEGVQHALDKNLATLETDWQTWLAENTAPIATAVPIGPDYDVHKNTSQMVLDSAAPWLLITGIMVLPVAVVLGGIVLKKRN